MITKNFKEKISHIKAFAFDCDGVLTNGKLIMMEDGEILRIYDAKDGQGIVFALKKGFPVAIITGGKGRALDARFKKLGVEDVYTLSEDKVACLMDFCEKHNLTPEEVMYVGDDVPDIPVMKVCGLAVAPSDAVLEVKAIAHHVSSYGGGNGCVRDLIEQVLKSQDKWSWQ